MSCTGHGRRNIAAAPANDLYSHLLTAYTHRVNCLGVTTSVLAIFVKMTFERAAHAGPPMLSFALRLIRRIDKIPDQR